MRGEKCQSCSRTFKTARGLLQHDAFKHEKLALPLPRLRSLVKESCQAIASDSYYGTEINAKFELYCRQVDIEDTFISEEFCKKRHCQSWLTRRAKSFLRRVLQRSSK